jgi:hypothetical protein
MAQPAIPTIRKILRTRNGLADRLLAFDGLLNTSSSDPTRLFDHGLTLLIKELKVNQVFICRSTDLGMEIFWWATANGEAPDLAVQELASDLCPRVLDDPGGTLLLQAGSHRGSRRLSRTAPGVGGRTFLGLALTRGCVVTGVLAILSRGPKVFKEAELAMAKTVAALFGKTLEIEQLKYDLQRTQEVLDLTKAVMEDGLLESGTTNLPNLRHLDVWMKPTLSIARRMRESMVLVRWRMPPGKVTLDALKALAKTLRGEDLLVDLGKDEFLLLLPRTNVRGAKLLLEDIRGKIGRVPMGATLWDPDCPQERSDHLLGQAQKRTKTALRMSLELEQDGAARVAWNLLDLNPADLRSNSPNRRDPSNRGRAKVSK